MSDSDFTTTIEMPQQACVISLALQLPLQLPLNLPSSLTLPLLLGLPLLLPLCPFLALTTALAPAPAPALDPILALALVLVLFGLPSIPTNLTTSVQGRLVAIDATVQRRPPGGLVSAEDAACNRLTELALNDVEVSLP